MASILKAHKITQLTDFMLFSIDDAILSPEFDFMHVNQQKILNTRTHILVYAGHKRIQYSRGSA